MERLNILDVIKKSRKYDIALLTSYNFEISFFERSILNKFYDNGIRRVSLFIDSKEFTKSLNDINYSYLGKRYIVTPVEMNSSFHPKVILLLGKDKARLIIGSNNLTTSGYYINNEVVNVFDFDENNIDNLKLIQETAMFFRLINEKTDKRDNELIEKINSYNYIHMPAKSNNVFLIHNINNSIFEQLNTLIQDDVESIDIAVPYYDNNIECLSEITNRYSNAKINLYIQNGTSTFPKKHEDKFHINLFDKFKDNDSFHFYHGKVFRFNAKQNTYILYGSANCTSAALTKSSIENGNIECDILEIGLTSEYDYYFNNFNLINNVEFESEYMTFDERKIPNFSYINNAFNKLSFKYKSIPENLSVSINGKTINYKTFNNELTIDVPMELLSELNDIFEVLFSYEDNCEIIRCYFNDIEQIETNRNQVLAAFSADINVSPDPNASVDKYLKDRMELISKFGIMYDIFNEKLDYYIKDNTGEDSELSETQEDFIDYDFKLSDEIQSKKKSLEQILKAKNHIFHTFREHLLSLSRVSSSSQVYDREKSNEHHYRNATSDEKAFARLVKRIIKDMLNKTNSNKLDFSNYFTSVIAIFETFNKFIIREKIEDMFTVEEVVKYQYDLINELSSKLTKEISEEEKDMFIWLSLACIIQTNYSNKEVVNPDYKVNLSNKSLLKLINDTFSIRENFDKYLLVSLAFVNEGQKIVDSDSAYNYIENLFDYKTNTQLLDLLKKEYGEKASINIAENNVLIETSTDNISKYFKLNDLPIIEIKKYYKNNNNILELINIKILNLKKDYPSTADPVNMIEYNLDEKENIYTQTIIRKSGMVEDPKIIKM